MTFDSNPTLPGVADPYPVYRSVRESDPVHWCTGACPWAVTRYADADAVLKDERFSRQGFLDGVEARMGHHVILEMQRHELVFTDNPRHGQLRALISEAITPQAVQALKPKIARLTNETLDSLLARGRMDVIGDFARTLPTQVAGAWLGVPAEDRAQIVEWIFPLVAGRGVAREAQTTAAANQAAEAFFGYFRQLVSRRRVSPEEDLTTALLKAQRADGKGIFSEDDLLSLIVAVFGAGHGPGIATIANTWLALLRNPSELAWLKAHPELIAKAVEEGLRYDPPTQAPNPPGLSCAGSLATGSARSKACQFRSNPAEHAAPIAVRPARSDEG